MNQFILKLRILLLQDKFFYILFIIFTSYALLSTNYVKYTSIYSSNNNDFNLRIISYKINGNKLSVQLKGKEKLIGNYYFKTLEEKDNFISLYKIGDKISVKGSLLKPKNNTIPNTFNYKKYLYNNKIYYILKIDELKLLKQNNNIFYKLKNYVYKKIENIKNNEYIYALVLGEIYYVDEEVNSSYNFNGISHIFALSGSHVSLLAAISIKIIKTIRKLLKRSIKEEKIKDYFIISILLFIFSFITGFKSSLLKSVFLFCLIGINKVYYFNIKSDNLLIISYIILIIINPFYIYDVGFQLSLTITFFLLYSTRYLKTKRYMKNLISSGSISLLSSIPILISNFYMINLFSLINNLFFIPFISFIVYPLSMFTFIFPFLSKILLFITNILEYISLKVSLIRVFNINFPKVSSITIIIFYVLLILIIRNKNKLMYFVFMILLLITSKYKNIFIKDTRLYFIDVSQGDSALIVTENKKTILIDTGGHLKYEMEDWQKRRKEFNLMTSNMIPFFKSISVDKINYLFLTHADEDHAGYVQNLIEDFRVENIIINNGEISSLESQLNYKKVGKYYEIDNIKIYSLNNKIYSNENDNSLILLIIINDKKILFMGDASVKQEKEIIKKYNLKNIYILKVGHHGSKTSTCEEFIKYINPEYSIISVGENNKFGHPNEMVLGTLKDSKIYRTDEYGTIYYNFNREKININYYKPY